MRIVAVADTHTFEADLGELPDGDVFVHAGDLLRAGTFDELAAVAQWIRTLPHRHKVVIAGNHDWCFARDPEAARAMLGDDVLYLQDSGIEIEGLKIWGSPWQPRFNDWAFNLERGPELAEKWALIPDDTDILITHGPPDGFGDRAWDSRTGCEDLLEAIRRVAPTLHLCGHIHQDGGVWTSRGTTFANVTTWECERGPTIIDVDPDSRAVRLTSVPPRDPHKPESLDPG
jgi:predicted phosphohydrolase